MKRHKTFIALLTILVTFTCSDMMAVYTSDNIRPADAYSDPSDYELIIMDNDGWELRMNKILEGVSIKRYEGILLYSYGGSVYTGRLRAVYYTTKGVLLVSCTDTGWHNYTLSYTLQNFNGDTYLDRTWDLSGLYLYLESGSSFTIGADIVKGELDN